MTSRAYYNEIDPYAAQWLRNLIAAGHIAPGHVDERDIRDVQPVDLAKYSQCHFFAGIGVWSHALRRSGIPDDANVWTGSCPCQPFSAAGKGLGFDDELHLWPAFHWLIQQCQPSAVFGEQVASKEGLNWFDFVQTDMENEGYAVWAVDTCSAGVGAPHIRQRLWWGAAALENSISNGRCTRRNRDNSEHDRRVANTASETLGLADMYSRGWTGICGCDEKETPRVTQCCETRPLAHAQGPECKSTKYPRTGGARFTNNLPTSRLELAHGGDTGAEREQCDSQHGQQPQNGFSMRSEYQRRQHQHDRGLRPGPTNGIWANADWLYCRDGKWRPVEPGTFPLAHGITNRVGQLRAYGNAINAEEATDFVTASVETLAEHLTNQAAE